MEIIRPISKQPIPENAKRVFNGVLFDVYEWEQEMFDGSKKKFEKIKRSDTVIVFPVLNDGKILLTKQEQPGKSSFVAATGGRIDEGEDILMAAKRELLEETGYDAEEFILWNVQHPQSKVDWVVYTFIAKGLKKVSEIHLDAGEKIELMPVTFSELVQIATTNPDFEEKEMIPEFFKARLDLGKMEELKELFKPKI